jgi:outer membrane receptor protein involved in Fe transport
MTFRYRGSAICALLACSVPAWAGEPDFLTVLDQENQVYAASRYVQSLQDAPASVSVLTREEMQRYGYYSLEQALYALPGVYNASNLAWPMFGIRGIAKPGDICSRFLVLINGMPAVYDPVFGGTCFQFLDIESLKRIEFVRGPGSAVYGSGAVLGVINLVTQTSDDAPGWTVSAKASTQREGQVFGSYGSGAVDGLQSYTSVSIKKRKGLDYYFPEYDTPPLTDGESTGNDGQRQWHAFGRLNFGGYWGQWRLERNRKVDPQGRYGTVFDTDRLVYDDRSASLELGHSDTLSSDATLVWRVYATKFVEYGDYPYDSTFSGVQGLVDSIYVDNIDTFQYGGELRYDTYMGSGHHLLVGAELREVNGRQYGGIAYLPYAHDIMARYTHYALFAQDEFNVSRDGRVTLGGRYVRYKGLSDGVGGRFVPRLAYVQRVSPRVSTKFVYGEAYRVPTLYEVYYDDGQYKIANQNLRPEIARTLETILQYEIAPGQTWSTSAYQVRLDDSVVLGQGSNGLCTDCGQYQNVDGYQQVTGIESSFEFKQQSGARGHISGTVQRGVEHPSERALPASPRRMLKAGMASPLPWAGVAAAVESQYVGGSKGPLQDGERIPMPDYWVFNVALVWDKRDRGWSGSLRVDNVFDHTVYTVPSNSLPSGDFGFLERIPMPGRTTSLRLDRDF